MKYINVVVEGSCEEIFVNDVLRPHFAHQEKFVSARRIRTGWDGLNNKPAKGGLLKYIKFRNDVLRWIQSDRDRSDAWYTSMLDLYAFPVDDQSPYTAAIRSIRDCYQKITALELAISSDINHARFIPYIQLHEFESFIFVEPERLITMYPGEEGAVNRLKKEVSGLKPEEINNSPHTAPSKRIIKYFPEYEGQKAQVGPLVVQDIGLNKLRQNCPHFNEWMTKLESI